MMIFNLTLSLAFFASLSGCASLSGPNVYLREAGGLSEVRKVAVFPFYNRTKSKEAAGVATGYFIAALFEKTGLQLAPQGNIRGLLIEKRATIRNEADLEIIKTIGLRLDVDAVIFGEVEEYGGGSGGTNVPTVEISSRMVAAKTGRILWMAHHRRTGEDYQRFLDYGRIASAGALTEKIAFEMIETMPWRKGPQTGKPAPDGGRS